MAIVDTLYTYKFIRLLSTEWVDTDAYALGIIDDEGNPLKKSWELTTQEEKKAYTSFVRLVFKLKRMLEKIPGGRSATVRYAAALLLIREEAKEMSIPFDILEKALKKYINEEVTNVTGGVDKPEKPLGKMHRRKHDDNVGVAVEKKKSETEVEERKPDKSPSDKTPDRKKTNEELKDDEDDDDYKDRDFEPDDFEDVDDWDEDDDDLEYDPDLDGPEDEWEEISHEDYEIYKAQKRGSQEESVSYQVIGGTLIRINEGKHMAIRIRGGKRIRRMEVKRKGFTRTGHRKMRGAKLARKRRSLKRAVRKSHRSGAMRKRHRSMIKRKRIVHH